MYRGGVNEDLHRSNQDEARIFRVCGALEIAALLQFFAVRRRVPSGEIDQRMLGAAGLR